MGLPQPVAEDMRFDDYRQFEEASEIKHEYIDGYIYAMAGISKKKCTPMLLRGNDKKK